MSAVNLAEVLSKLDDIGMPPMIAADLVIRLGLTIEPFDQAHTERVGRLRTETRPLGLSLGDRSCLALAQELGLPAYTADRTWAAVNQVEVRVIR